MQQQGGPMSLALPIVLFVLIFYFLIFRPQKKKQQQHDNMVASIGRGDTIITAGGFFGKVSDILEDSYVIEIAEGVKVRILKSSISVKREGADPGARPKSDRPRRKKRRRPVGEGDVAAIEAESIDTAVDASDEFPDAESSPEGVTEAENEVLLQEDAGEVAAEEEKNEK